MQLITHFLLVSSSLFINSQIPTRPTNTILDSEEAPEKEKKESSDNAGTPLCFNESPSGSRVLAGF